MSVIKKYIKPYITVIEIKDSKILCSSSSTDYVCSEFCKHWHFCQDRHGGKYCSDKKYK